MFKRFKKLNIYIRLVMVYLLFMLIRWCIFKSTGIEVGVIHEGLIGTGVGQGSSVYNSNGITTLGKSLPPGWAARPSEAKPGFYVYENVYTTPTDNPDPLIPWVPTRPASEIPGASPDLTPSAAQCPKCKKGNNAGSPFPRLPPPPLPEPGDDPPWEFFCDTEVLPDPPFNKESDDPRLYFCPPPIDKEAIWQAKADRHAAALEKKNQLTRAAGGNFIKDPEPPPPSTVIIDAGYIGKGASSWNRNFKFKN